MHNKLTQLWPIILLGTAMGTLHSFDNDHFYRASFFWGEPRFARNQLSSLDMRGGGGSTTQGYNSCHNKTNILNIYGLYNMHMLGAGVPNKNLATPVDLSLTMLEEIRSRDNFGTFCFNGKFNIAEGTFSLIHNVTENFFLQVYLPIRSLEISNVTYTDLSPVDPQLPNINTPSWQTFLHLFDATLAQYDLSIQPTKQSGVGDISFLVGWTYNYQDTVELDFVDTSIAVGIIAPSGARKNENCVFSLPLGYNGHVGIPIECAAALGAYEWFTVGTNFGAIGFLEKSKELRMKTNINQSGMIKLAQGCACVRPGILWHISLYAKADHIIRGLSFLLGYNFSKKNDDSVNPANTAVFNYAIVNSDPQFRSWQMHTIQCLIEYDFAKDGWRVGPRIGAFYNQPVGGARIFATGVGGGSFGLDVAWKF